MSYPGPDDHHGGGSRRLWLWAVFLGILLALVIGLYALSLYDPSLLRSDGGVQRLVYLLAILVLVGPALFLGRLSRNFRNLAVWAILIMVVVAGYTYWQRGNLDIGTVTAELAPQKSTTTSPSEARFVANRNGDFIIEAEVQGTRVVFLVDTGASQVVLSREDAIRVGFKPDRLNYTQRYMTANGVIFGAPIRIEWMTVGGIDVSNVSASVPDSELGTSLLGMSFLNRLGGFSVSDGMLTMTK